MQTATRTTFFNRKLALAAVTAIAFVASLFYIRSRTAAIPCLQQLPSPNGYDDLLQAASAIQGFPIQVIGGNAAELRSFLGSNQTALAMMRTGLGRECVVPLNISTNFSLEGIVTRSRLHNLLFLPEISGKLAELEGRKYEASRDYLEQVRLGEALSHGGIIVDKLREFTGTTVGLDGLNRLRNDLSVEACRELFEALRRVDANREPFSTVNDRDDAATRKMVRGWEGLRYRISSFYQIFTGQRSAVRNNIERTFRRQDARLRLLILELSIRCHFLEKSGYPKYFSDLVPQYLPQIPKDPFTGKDFIYRAGTNGFFLYSVGPDRVDNGGQPLAKTANDDDIPKGDIRLNPQPQN